MDNTNNHKNISENKDNLIKIGILKIGHLKDDKKDYSNKEEENCRIILIDSNRK